MGFYELGNGCDTCDTVQSILPNNVNMQMDPNSSLVASMVMPYGTQSNMVKQYNGAIASGYTTQGSNFGGMGMGFGSPYSAWGGSMMFGSPYSFYNPYSLFKLNEINSVKRRQTKSSLPSRRVRYRPGLLLFLLQCRLIAQKGLARADRCVFIRTGTQQQT